MNSTGLDTGNKNVGMAMSFRKYLNAQRTSDNCKDSPALSFSLRKERPSAASAANVLLQTVVSGNKRKGVGDKNAATVILQNYPESVMRKR
jgi:RNase H-fold protein (predicted Holliday junction resolvase)